MEKKVIMKTFFILFGVFVLVAAVSAGLCVNAYREGSGFEKSDKLINSVTIDDIIVGGMSLNEAKNAIKEYTDKLLKETISIKVSNKIYTPTYKELGVSYDIDAAIDKAYNYGRSGNPFKDLLAINNIGVYDLSVEKKRNDEKVMDYVNNLATHSGLKAKNASLYRDNGKIFVVPSQKGITIDKVKCGQMIIEALNNGETSIVLPVKEDMPKISTESLQKINKRLSVYQTTYNSGKVGRSANLALACKKINAHIIMPGEVFSFNKIVGPRTIANGFKNAIVFEQGQEVEGLGGGICQVSSTVFNAVLLAGLEIVQRRCHSLKVVYVPIGRDAMVSYGSQDFQFKNNAKNPIVIFANAYRGKLDVEIWGNESDKKNCQISQSLGDNGFYAKIIRYVVDGNGNKTATYSANSVYQRPKPKTTDKPKIDKKPKGQNRAMAEDNNNNNSFTVKINSTEAKNKPTNKTNSVNASTKDSKMVVEL